jgi:hypothetical protein
MQADGLRAADPCVTYTKIAMELSWDDTCRGKSKYWKEQPVTSATLSAANLSWNDLVSNLRFSVEIQRTGGLSYSAACLKTMTHVYHI